MYNTNYLPDAFLFRVAFNTTHNYATYTADLVNFEIHEYYTDQYTDERRIWFYESIENLESAMQVFEPLSKWEYVQS